MENNFALEVSYLNSHKVTIACVFKTGIWHNAKKVIEYSAAQVGWLRDMVAARVTVPHRFVCLSDDPAVPCERIPLIHGWPGWWSKMELYRPELFDGPVFYIDLDTVVTANIDDMLAPGKPFVALLNLTRKKGIGSGVLAWEGDYSFLYHKFCTAPEKLMAEYSVSGSRWGDQGFLQENLPEVSYWQDLFPGAVQSFKFDLEQKDPTPEMRIVCFHGLPKPWQVERPWIPRLVA